MAKKKKDLDLKIDTKNVDVSVIRKDGKTKVEVDTNILDVTIDNTQDETKVDVKVEDGSGFLGKVAKTILKRSIK